MQTYFGYDVVEELKCDSPNRRVGDSDVEVANGVGHLRDAVFEARQGRQSSS